MNADNAMRFASCLFGSMMLAGALPLSAAMAADGAWATGRIVMKARPGVSDGRIALALKRNMAREVSRLPSIELRVIEVPHGFEDTVAKALAADPLVTFAEVDYYARPAQLSPNDPTYITAWHLPKIEAPAAWDLSQGYGVTVAVVDSGVEATHPDLIARLVPGRNIVSGNDKTTDTFGHGTKVAGIIGADTNNGIGVAAIARDAYIMPIRISEAVDGSTTNSIIAAGIIWAADNGARVANVSYEIKSSVGVQNAAAYMRSKGGVVVAPSGNAGKSLGMSDNPDVITVGATDRFDLVPYWSNYGEVIDLVAPGSLIPTTAIGGYNAWASGTSFAAPVVSGVAALVIAANPTLTAAEIEQILEDSAVDLGAAGWDIYSGHGRVNAAAAVRMAKAWVPRDVQAPTVAITSPAAGITVADTASVEIRATDNLGVTVVKLYAAGVEVGSATTAPYVVSLDTKAYANGTLQLSARAYDAAGNEGLADSVAVNVYNAAPDTTAPTARVAVPNADRPVSGRVVIASSASDNVRVASMTLYVDNSKLCAGTSAALSCAWNATLAARGYHKIRVVAADTSGNTSASEVQVRR